MGCRRWIISGNRQIIGLRWLWFGYSAMKEPFCFLGKNIRSCDCIFFWLFGGFLDYFLTYASSVSRDPCFWKKLRPKWTKNHSSINFWPIIKNDVRFFSLLNVDYGTAKKIAKFYSFGRFLGPKRLKIDEKWLNFACHFLNDPERRACGDFFY